MSFTPVDPHYKFYKALREGKFLLRTDSLDGVEEVIDLTHPRIKGVPSNIYNFDWQDLKIIEMADQQPVTAIEEAAIKGFNEGIELCAERVRKLSLPVNAGKLLSLRKPLPDTIRKPTEILQELLKDKTKVSQEELKSLTEFVEQAWKRSLQKVGSVNKAGSTLKPNDVWQHPQLGLLVVSAEKPAGDDFVICRGFKNGNSYKVMMSTEAASGMKLIARD